MHRSGLPMGNDPGPSSLGLVAELAAAETEWEPGTRFWYSNIGYDALGFALEARAGLPFPELLRRRVLEPLGMHESVANIAAADRSRLADGHDGLHPDMPWHPGFGLVTAPFAPSEGASGSILSTAGDMARYVRHLLARGPCGFDRMIDGVPDDEGEPYGFGLRVTQRDGHTVVAHSGGMVGYVAQMLCDMDDEVGAIALTNGPAGATTVAEYALDLARAQKAQAASADPPADGRSTSASEPAVRADHRRRGRHRARGATGISASPSTTLQDRPPRLCADFVRFGRSAGGRVDHSSSGDDWYPARGTPARRVPAPARMGAYPASTARTTRGFRRCASRSAGASWPGAVGLRPHAARPHPTGGFARTTPEGRLPERLQVRQRGRRPRTAAGRRRVRPLPRDAVLEAAHAARQGRRRCPKPPVNGQSDVATCTSRRWLTAIGSALAQDPHPLTDPPAESSAEPFDR